MKRSTIDHKARKQEIIASSIRLFAKLGYKDVSFREISEHCGVARTVLYRYFRNKRQIFDLAIVQALLRIQQKHAEIVNTKQPTSQRLHQVCMVVMATLFDNREFLQVIVDFVMSIRRDGFDISRRILKYTIGLKRILHTLLVLGIHRGEFRSDANADIYTELIYAQFESTVLRLAVSGNAVMTDVLDQIDEILKGLEPK